MYSVFPPILGSCRSRPQSAVRIRHLCLSLRPPPPSHLLGLGLGLNMLLSIDILRVHPRFCGYPFVADNLDVCRDMMISNLLLVTSTIR